MPKQVCVRVRPDVTYGAMSEHKPGTLLYVTEGELVAFPDKLERVIKPPSTVISKARLDKKSVLHTTWRNRSLPDVSRYATVSVLEMVDAGLITAEEVIGMERLAAEPRVTLIRELMLRNGN